MFYIQFLLNLDQSRIGKKETHVKLSPSMIHVFTCRLWGESSQVLNGRDIKHYENAQPLNNPPPKKQQQQQQQTNKTQKVIE